MGLELKEAESITFLVFPPLSDARKTAQTPARTGRKPTSFGKPQRPHTPKFIWLYTKTIYHFYHFMMPKSQIFCRRGRRTIHIPSHSWISLV